MTFSIVARCPSTGQIGVGACTAMMGVGKLVSHARARVGAIATQAFINPYYGFDGLKLLARERPPQEVLQELRANDPNVDLRQVGIIDNQSRTAAWSGSQIAEWAGDMAGEHCCAQGNRLVGPETLEATLEAFLSQPGSELADRLLLALEAGENTGADRKGARSANITVFDTEDYPLWDMRVDYARDPVKSLRKLHRKFSRALIPNVRKLPTRAEPAGQLTSSDESLG